jgi:ABC-type branched-subunit amino acid transport system ATPase component
VRPAYGVHARRTVGQNLIVAQLRSGRAADLEWVDRVAYLMGLHGVLGYRSADGPDLRRARWTIARSLVVRPSLVLVNDVTAGLERADEQELNAALEVSGQPARGWCRHGHA